MSERARTSIGAGPFERLDVELMQYTHMPGKHAVSLIYPAGAFNQQTRIINLDPQTALNLLTWLEQQRDTLTHLREKEKPQE